MIDELWNAKNIADKYLVLFLLMNEWVKVKQKNLSISGALKDREIYNVGIYGMSYVGQRLFDELERTDIKIGCCIDRNAGGVYKKRKIVSIEDISHNLDAVIVTPIFYYEEIKSTLKGKCEKILSLEEIIYGLTVKH